MILVVIIILIIILSNNIEGFHSWPYYKGYWPYKGLIPRNYTDKKYIKNNSYNYKYYDLYGNYYLLN